MKADAPKRWLITGVSSGLGFALAEAALARGDSVAGTLRDRARAEAFSASAPGRAHGLVCDVRDEAGVSATIAEAARRMGGLDIVVNNAGYCLTSAFEEATSDQIQAQFDVNVFGLMHVTRAALPIFRAAGAGRFINIASLAGVMGYPGMSLYAASKFAVVGFSDALAKETARFGIRVTAVAPSGFRTQFAGGSMQFGVNEVADYQGLRQTLRERLAQSNGAQPNDPARGAEALLALADHPDPPTHFALGFDALGRIAEAISGRLREYEQYAPMGAATGFKESV
ncbi:MAG: SDR family NAD(P)-dependent oxidoreductase [Caulobacterales bacterium]|nr:SDR family NAD(P)-dependent oxidoreductase [Caulobacterales bacterium]